MYALEGQMPLCSTTMLLGTDSFYRCWFQASIVIFTEISMLWLTVYYRYFTREHAQAYKLTGWVRNKSDGNVSSVVPA